MRSATSSARCSNIVKSSLADRVAEEAIPAPSAAVPVRRWRNGERLEYVDTLAEETPVAIVINGHPHAVMLVTPGDLDDFILGFCLTESIIDQPCELLRVGRRVLDDGVELRITIPRTRAGRLARSERGLAGRSSCGMCGKRMLDDAMRTPPAVRSAFTLSRAALAKAAAALGAHQHLNAETGAVHAAAWADAGGDIVAVREDIGRHNALDKLVGALVARGQPPGFLLMTSRASHEIVQKAAMAGMPVVAAISAPTARAVRLATACNMTLLGFVRGDDHVVYSHPDRLLID